VLKSNFISFPPVSLGSGILAQRFICGSATWPSAVLNQLSFVQHLSARLPFPLHQSESRCLFSHAISLLETGI
jgi:hypothetical protein